MDISARFWSKVAKAGHDDCWQWLARERGKGYGGFTISHGNDVYAHRMAWELTHGVIPQGDGYHGTCVLHRCDNRMCCNPAHLFLGSNRDNALDMIAKGRHTPQRGEINARAKLTADQVRAIRADTRLQRLIADDYKINKNYVSAIKTKKAWAHVI